MSHFLQENSVLSCGACIENNSGDSTHFFNLKQKVKQNTKNLTLHHI